MHLDSGSGGPRNQKIKALKFIKTSAATYPTIQGYS
jgi:hypothetical protein